MRERLERARAQGEQALEAESRCALAELLAARGQHAQALTELQALLDGIHGSAEQAPLRRRAHRAAWHAAKALGRFEFALVHCEAVLALESPSGGAPAVPAGAARARDTVPAGAAEARDNVPAGAARARDSEFVEHEIAPLVEQVRLRRKPLALAALELDHLAALSSRVGPAAADAALRQLGDLMRQRLRARDVPLRRGETAFVLALSDTPPAAASAICERLRAAVEQHDWSRIAPGIALTVSIGLVASVSGGDAAAELERADAALHAARTAGGNRVVPAPAA